MILAPREENSSGVSAARQARKEDRGGEAGKEGSKRILSRGNR